MVSIGRDPKQLIQASRRQATLPEAFDERPHGVARAGAVAGLEARVVPVVQEEDVSGARRFDESLENSR